MKVFLQLSVALLIALILDAITKTWAVQTFLPYQPVPVMGQFFRFTLGFNTGVAFSMFTNSGMWPLVMTGVIMVVLGVWAIRELYHGELPSPAAWPVGFILGGAMANFVDRLLDGSVVDFIDVGLAGWRWPAFNMADSCIVIGVIWLMLIKMQIPDSAENADETDPDKSTIEYS